MSSDGHNEHVPGSTEPRELSHPVLWTLGLLVSVGALAYVFFHFKQVGREHVRGEPVWALPVAAAGPDHAALIADKSEAVIDRGQVLYGKNCASCHGANGDSNPGNTNPVPRNLRTEHFKNKNGSGPYGFFTVLTDGYGAAMPAFRNLSPEDRYAVVHFVREAWMKPNAEQSGYLAKDADAVAKLIPASGAAAGGAEAPIDPAAIKPPATTWPLMAADAKAADAQRARLVRWLGDAAADCGPELLPAFRRIRAIAPNQLARLDHLFVAAQTQDRVAFNAILIAEDGAGSADPYFSLLGEDTLRKLYARLAETATRTN